MRPAAALLVLLLTPIAGAHAIPADLAIVPRATPLPFEDEEPAPLALTFDYRCEGLASGNKSALMSVRFDVVDPAPWLVARVEPAVIDPLPECDGVGQVTARLLMAVKRDAPAPMPATVNVRAAWTTEGFVLNVTAATNVTAPWIPAFTVNASTTEITDRPQTPVVFPITITNLGNGNTRFLFEVVEKTGGLLVPLPNPVTLQASGAHSSALVPFTVMTPFHNGKVSSDGIITLKVTPTAALDPGARGEPQELTLTVHTRGWYVPGPELLAAIGALALVAGLRARRRVG